LLGAKDERSPLDRGGFLVSAKPLSGKPPGVGYWWRREMLTESLDKSNPCAVGFFFTNPELSLELWNVIVGISGFDD